MKTSSMAADEVEQAAHLELVDAGSPQQATAERPNSGSGWG